MVILLSDDSFIILNDRGAYAVADNTTATFACVGILNDSDAQFFHSAVDFSSNDSLANNNIVLESQNSPNEPIIVNFMSTVINGDLTCRSRTSGKEQSVYIGGRYQMWPYRHVHVYYTECTNV